MITIKYCLDIENSFALKLIIHIHNETINKKTRRINYKKIESSPMDSPIIHQRKTIFIKRITHTLNLLEKSTV